MRSPLQTPRTRASALRERPRTFLRSSFRGRSAAHLFTSRSLRGAPAWLSLRGARRPGCVSGERDAASSTYVVSALFAARGHRPTWLWWLMDECMWSWWVWGHTRARAFFHGTEEEGLSVYRETHL